MKENQKFPQVRSMRWFGMLKAFNKIDNIVYVGSSLPEIKVANHLYCGQGHKIECRQTGREREKER